MQYLPPYRLLVKAQPLLIEVMSIPYVPMSLGTGLEVRVLSLGADAGKEMARPLLVEASVQPVEDH